MTIGRYSMERYAIDRMALMISALCSGEVSETRGYDIEDWAWNLLKQTTGYKDVSLGAASDHNAFVDAINNGEIK